MKENELNVFGTDIHEESARDGCAAMVDSDGIDVDKILRSDNQVGTFVSEVIQKIQSNNQLNEPAKETFAKVSDLLDFKGFLEKQRRETQGMQDGIRALSPYM